MAFNLEWIIQGAQKIRKCSSAKLKILEMDIFETTELKNIKINSKKLNKVFLYIACLLRLLIPKW